MSDDKEQATPVFEYVEVSFPTYYTNSVKFSGGLGEIHMLLMERLDDRNITVRARIVTSPHHAKLMAIALAQQIDKYERRFGEIQLSALNSDEPSSEPEPQP